MLNGQKGCKDFSMAIDQASSAQGRNMLPGSALEMQRGLRHPDRLQRASLLRAIRNDPDRALCVGQGDGWDIVDELIFLCEESKGTADRWDYVFTTLSLADERTVDLTKNEFLTTFDHRFLVMSARRLSQLPEAEKAGFFSPVIMESRETNRCRLCANVWPAATFSRRALPSVWLRLPIVPPVCRRWTRIHWTPGWPNFRAPIRKR
jgi:hypothetical protein